MARRTRSAGKTRSRCAKRGIGVIGAFNIAHLETVAPTAEALLGYPVREIIPLSFLQSRRRGDRARRFAAHCCKAACARERSSTSRTSNARSNGVFKEQTLYMLRELLLRTVDSLTLPVVKAGRSSMAAAFVYPEVDPAPFLRRTAAIAHALDLALEVVPGRHSKTQAARARRARARRRDSSRIDRPGERHRRGCSARGAGLAFPTERSAAKLANAAAILTTSSSSARVKRISPRIRRARPTRTPPATDCASGTESSRSTSARPPAPARRMRCWIARTNCRPTASTSSAASSKRTAERKRPQLLDGLEVLPPKIMTGNGITYKEFDRDALIARHPQVALIDELAHTNAPGSIAPKRYYDVLAVLRAGIDVITTLNIQHLEGLGDTVCGLTGTIVRETLPDGILPLADEVILIDVTPDTLRQRLREGKIYPPERIDAALANFFRTENLFALRELALREALRARYRERIASPFERLLLSVGSRAIDLADDRPRRAHRGAPRHRIRDRARHRPERTSRRRSRRDDARRGAQDERRMDRRRPPRTCRGACSKSRELARNDDRARGHASRAALARGTFVRAPLTRRGRARAARAQPPRSGEPSPSPED